MSCRKYLVATCFLLVLSLVVLLQMLLLFFTFLLDIDQAVSRHQVSIHPKQHQQQQKQHSSSIIAAAPHQTHHKKISITFSV